MLILHSALARAMDRLALAANHAPQEPPASDAEPYMPGSPRRHVLVEAPTPPDPPVQSSKPKPRAVLDLPPPDSDEWETMVLPPAPRPAEAKRRVTRSAQKST